MAINNREIEFNILFNKLEAIVIYPYLDEVKFAKAKQLMSDLLATKEDLDAFMAVLMRYIANDDLILSHGNANVIIQTFSYHKLYNQAKNIFHLMEQRNFINQRMFFTMINSACYAKNKESVENLFYKLRENNLASIQIIDTIITYTIVDGQNELLEQVLLYLDEKPELYEKLDFFSILNSACAQKQDEVLARVFDFLDHHKIKLEADVYYKLYNKFKILNNSNNILETFFQYSLKYVEQPDRYLLSEYTKLLLQQDRSNEAEDLLVENGMDLKKVYSNTYPKTVTIDLHNQTATTAKFLLDCFLAQQKKPIDLILIVGQGKHSKDGQHKMPDVVHKVAEKYGCKVEPGKNKGRLVLEFKPIKIKKEAIDPPMSIEPFTTAQTMKLLEEKEEELSDREETQLMLPASPRPEVKVELDQDSGNKNIEQETKKSKKSKKNKKAKKKNTESIPETTEEITPREPFSLTGTVNHFFKQFFNFDFGFYSRAANNAINPTRPDNKPSRRKL